MLSELALDIRTLAFVAMLTAVLQAVLLVALWRAVPRSAGTPIWAAGGALLALGFVLLTFRHILPDALTIVVANLAIAGAHVLYLFGIERYCGRPLSLRSGAAVLLATLLLFIVFGLVAPSTEARIVVISAAILIPAGLSSWCLWQREKNQQSPVDALMAALCATHAAFHLARGIYTAAAERGMGDFMQASTVHAFAFIDLIVFSFASGIGFAVLTISTLHRSLEKELADNNRLFSVLAHDLRSPFSGLVNLSDLVQIAFDRDKKEQVEELARQLSQNAKQVLAMLDDLLVWGMAEIRGEKPRSEPLDLDAVTESAIGPQAAIVAAKGIEVRKELNSARAFGVRAHAEMVLRNLLSNALKFSRSGSEVTITSQRRDGRVVVSVVDRGIGLSGATVPQDDGSDGYLSRRGTDGEQGTGLGLSLCKDLCRNDGQQLWLEPNTGGGTIASFTLNVWEPGNLPKGKDRDTAGPGNIAPVEFRMTA